MFPGIWLVGYFTSMGLPRLPTFGLSWIFNLYIWICHILEVHTLSFYKLNDMSSFRPYLEWVMSDLNVCLYQKLILQKVKTHHLSPVNIWSCGISIFVQRSGKNTCPKYPPSRHFRACYWPESSSSTGIESSSVGPPQAQKCLLGFFWGRVYFINLKTKDIHHDPV